jgi:hypothetical protein
MNKAFTPHGLLYACLRDKEERSACRQEECGHESGATLLNVAHKPPPPPPPGLLGAITAHPRERKREGGFGAAPTEHRNARSARRRSVRTPRAWATTGVTTTRTGRRAWRSPRARRTRRRGRVVDWKDHPMSSLTGCRRKTSCACGARRSCASSSSTSPRGRSSASRRSASA